VRQLAALCNTCCQITASHITWISQLFSAPGGYVSRYAWYYGKSQTCKNCSEALMRFSWAAVFSGLDSVPLTPSTRLGMWSAMVLQSPISSSCEDLLVLWCPAPWAAAMHCVAVLAACLAAACQQYSQPQYIHVQDKFIRCPTFST